MKHILRPLLDKHIEQYAIKHVSCSERSNIVNNTVLHIELFMQQFPEAFDEFDISTTSRFINKRPNDDYVVDFINKYDFKLFCASDWTFIKAILDNDKSAYEDDHIDVFVKINMVNKPRNMDLIVFYMEHYGFAKFDRSFNYDSLNEICITYALKEVNMDIFGPYLL